MQPFSWLRCGRKELKPQPSPKGGPCTCGKKSNVRGQPESTRVVAQNPKSCQLEVSGRFPTWFHMTHMTRTFEQISQQEIGELTKWGLQQHSIAQLWKQTNLTNLTNLTYKYQQSNCGAYAQGIGFVGIKLMTLRFQTQRAKWSLVYSTADVFTPRSFRL